MVGTKAARVSDLARSWAVQAQEATSYIASDELDHEAHCVVTQRHFGEHD